MFYFDRKQYKIVEVSELDVIALFGKSEADFERMTVRNPDMLVYSSEKYDSDGFTYIFDTREEVINLIREELEDEAAWDLDNDWDLEIIKKLRLAIA
ncbi:hypothetical protein [Neisseria sp. P0019.S003]|uniref:hypothetical protein n=1 Tax=Neisseria sp. P0019.S003 TaxID=3436799 RepID=UPI003F80B31B